MRTIALYRDFNPRDAAGHKSRNAPARTPTGIVRRIFAAIEQKWRRRAEQDIARFIAAHGGRLTDDVERQIGVYLAGRGFPPHA